MLQKEREKNLLHESSSTVKKSSWMYVCLEPSMAAKKQVQKLSIVYRRKNLNKVLYTLKRKSKPKTLTAWYQFSY